MNKSLLILTALLLLLQAPGAQAQLTFPRLGFSASAESYVDTMTVEMGQEFTLYVCAFGFAPGDPLNQDVAELQWVMHQVCCGGVLEVVGVQYNPAFTHVGDPYSGVTSSSEACVNSDAIMLATLTMTLTAPEPGGYLAAAGPYAAASDCEGNHPLFMDMSMVIYATGEITPVASTTWGALKATYR